MRALSEDEYAALLRVDLETFIHRVFLQLHPGGGYSPNWHIALLAHHLERVRRGECRRLIINVPPRSLKSLTASVAFPAWILGHDPTRRIICASYGQELADKLARDTKSVMSAEWYQQTFDTRLSPERSATADFQTTAQGGRMATSVGGGITGRGGDILILDDVMKPEDALSEAIRRSTNEWFDHTLYSRLNNKVTDAIVVIMQRLHLGDLVAHVQSKEPWEVVSLPAIADEDESWTYETLQGPIRHVRKQGEPLHPERESLETLDVIRRSVGEYVFSAQYQQCPVPFGGGMIKAKWLKYAEPSEFPESFDYIVQSWDSASKASELSDYSVCTTWGVRGGHRYLLHVLRKRLDYPSLKRAVQEQAQLWAPRTVLVEDAASGIQLIQELSTEGVPQMKSVKPNGDKQMRVNTQTAVFENGFVILPKSAPWLDEYVSELVSFPMGNFDDQVDSTAQAMAYITEAGREPGIITYYTELCARNGWD